jgi:hypothetical protein
MFDAQCDFAAIAYEIDDDPDGLLLQFAGDLSRSGHRVVGLVQHHVHGPRNLDLQAFMQAAGCGLPPLSLRNPVYPQSGRLSSCYNSTRACFRRRRLPRIHRRRAHTLRSPTMAP